ATVTGRTPHIAVELASDKEETNKILASLGLPVPRQLLVTSQTDALKAARRRGGPVVLKPYNGNHGRGITINLSGDEEIRDDLSLLVVNGELVAATRRTPGHVVGDGTHAIAELVELVNQDPRRGVGHEKVLTRLELDREAQLMMERAGHAADSVPKEGEIVY